MALSGGVDSALVAFAALRALGPRGAAAATADYRTLSAEELRAAARACSEIGIRHLLVRYDELENGRFVANDRSRCMHCRTELASRLADLARARGYRTVVDGAHLDDLGDYRPGMRAMREGGVLSPLAETGFTKGDVRREARAAGLSMHGRPANSCLASRIPWGRRVTAERLARIELAESMVRNATGARIVRVRDMHGAARIEVDRGHVGAASEPRVLAGLGARLRMIGFESVSVDPGGYGRGKANAPPGRGGGGP